MKFETTVRKKIIRNALLSLFIYVLPIALMFLTFYFTGQRPWEKKQPSKELIKTTHKKQLNDETRD
jgi:hypothetical protein